MKIALLLLLAVVVCGASFFVTQKIMAPAPSTAATSEASSTAPATTTPSAPAPATVQKWGAFTADQSLVDFESEVGKKVDIQATFVGWDSGFPADFAADLGQSGKTLLIFWEPSFGYDQINDGSHDEYIREFAAEARGYGYPVILVPFDEMNLEASDSQDAWGYGANNNSPKGFIAAFQHVHDLFAQAGATNVKFGLAYNNISEPNVAGNQVDDYYPGSAYVDYIGVDGFNYSGENYGAMFDTTLPTLEAYKKPIMIFSSGLAASAAKAGEITGMFAWLKVNPEIVGWLWFNQDGSDGNWAVDSDPASLAAFKKGLQSL